MTHFNKLLLASAISSFVFLSGCGGSDSGGSNGGTDDPTTGSISGTVEAPSGTVAALEPKSVFEIATAFFVAPVAAAITGLEPVQGADVELIRIDNNGNQVGDVLARTVTSITGDYELTLPVNVDLSGDLIVRITGTNDTTMSAQVVEQDVDINPVSEFVLRKFVQSGADLSALVVTDVVSLRGKAEEFDLVAGNDLSAMMEALELEVGEYVESQIEVVTATPGAVSAVAGVYRSSALSLELQDANGMGSGTYFADLWMANFSFADGGDGTVTIGEGSEEGAQAGLYGMTVESAGVWYETYSDDASDSFPGTYSDSGVLAIQGEFEEDIEGDFGWRSPAIVYNLQQVRDKGLFVLLAQEASVRYATIDTNDDGIKDAVDPDQPEGDEISRSIEFFARKPSAMTSADLVGDFGRVYVESFVGANGPVELRSETNLLTFNGDGTFDYGDITGHSLALSGTGTVYTPLAEAGAAGVGIVVTADGDIESIGGAAEDGFVNDSFDFISILATEGVTGDRGQFGKTLMVKLPTAQPAVTGKSYRLMFLAMHLSGTGNGSSEFAMTNSQFNTFINMTSATEGTLSGKFTEVVKVGLAGNMSVVKDTVDALAITTSIAANGAATVTVPSTEGDTIMEGYFNEDASLGVFGVRWEATGSGVADEIGLAVLVEVD